MALSVFYDFETSDRFYLSQILSYSFIAVDEDFKVSSELSGTIRLSRLQLPSYTALLTNRINILDHQRDTQKEEAEAALEIKNYLEGLCPGGKEKLPLIGFNSSRFDLQFLRTTLMRNGLNPYFNSRIAYRDVLHAVKKLHASDSGFPRPVAPETVHTAEPRLSLALENVCRELDILKAPQSHDAREDVLLTIELARVLKERFGLDVRRYDGYEALFADESAGRGQVFVRIDGNYDLRESTRVIEAPVSLLASDYRGALWVDLKRFSQGEGRGSISYFTKSTAWLHMLPDPLGQGTWQELARAAMNEFAGLNTRNFFQPSTCDIEQDIYRLDRDMLEALYEAIWLDRSSRLEALQSHDARVVLTRNRLARWRSGAESAQGMVEKLRGYALYRYGGRALLWKTAPAEGTENPEAWHWTFKSEISGLDKTIQAVGPADRQILESLKEFYLSSEVYQCAASSLLS